MGLGLLLPTVTYLRQAGVLPLGIMGIDPTVVLGNVGLLMLPVLVAMLTSLLAIPAVVQEVESRTIERLLSLPVSWRDVFLSKLLFHHVVGLAVAYVAVIVYFSLSSAIVANFHFPALLTYIVILVPTVVFYSVSAGLFVSARTRSVKGANVLGGVLTWGLFGIAFFIAQALRVELGSDFLLGVSLVLLLIGLVLAYLTVKLDPERLLCANR
jgi:ABC-type Na+ efflux pump permease subunit